MTTWHPLAQYPGPFLAKLTDLYSVWHAIRGTRHWDLYKLHQVHGDFVRWGPNSISINSASAIKQIYGAKANVKKSAWYNAFNSLSIFSAVEKDVHARKRRVMVHAFSEEAVREAQPYIVSVSRTWCAALGDRLEAGTAPPPGQWSTPKNMQYWSAYVIFDALGELLLGESFKTTTQNENRFFLDLMASNSRFINLTGQMPLLGRFNLSSALFRNAHGERRKKQFAFLRNQLQRRLALGSKGKDRKDTIHYLQRAKDPETGQGYSEKELMGEAALLLGAGSDTANTSLTAIFYFLAHNPSVLARLTQSIRGSFNSVEDICSGHVLSSNAYLRACVDEAQRLCPPVPMLLPREVCAGGLHVMGHEFAAGTVIGIPTYSLHHDSRYFDRPFEYDPSRWFVKGNAEGEEDGQNSEVLARQRSAFIPFSFGPRACIGRNVALFELYMTVARTVFLYDIRLQPGMEHLGVGPEREYKIRDYFIVGKEGPILQFRPAVSKTP
ncbi:MAG: hypothetical protein M1820_007062 [Bogoriella megaspora]|nr:MAG: hypothetical protein M1820_007062 [Bogoriella megaspora]